MNFPDWRKMGGGQRSCITHAQVLDYLKDYADHFDIRKYITVSVERKNLSILLAKIFNGSLYIFFFYRKLSMISWI